MTHNFSSNIEVLRNKLLFNDKLGTVHAPLYGKDLYFLHNKIFIPTTASFNQMLSFLSKKSSGAAYGFFVELTLVGLGYRFIKLQKTLLLKLGFSHYIKIFLPQNVVFMGYKKKLIIFGISMSEVQQLSRKLIAFRSPDVYKNKGMQLVGKQFRLKIGKQK